MPTPNVLPAAEVARRKGCTTQTVYNALSRGDLTDASVGTHRLVLLDAKFEQWEPKETGGRLHRRNRDDESNQ